MHTVVVILNWNGVNHLQTYLPSVVTHSNSDIYVIDNGSSDNSVKWITENHPEIRIIRLEENLGFAGGYNAGLKKIDADRYVLLNSDVRVSSGWIESVNKSMLQNGWAICAPVILDDNNNEYYEYAGAAGGYIDKDGYITIVGRSKDLIITGGLNVYPKEIELKIDKLPGVIESAVIGTADADFGEAVTAIIIAEPSANLSGQMIIEQLEGSIANFKVPKAVHFLENPLP